MSNYEMKDGQCSLFKNTQKEKENQPDFRGKLMLDGKLYYISFWSRKTDGGNIWLSGNVQPADKPKPVKEEEVEDFIQKAELKASEEVQNTGSIETPPQQPIDDLPF
jgi:hypothetical protein